MATFRTEKCTLDKFSSVRFCMSELLEPSSENRLSMSDEEGQQVGRIGRSERSYLVPNELDKSKAFISSRSDILLMYEMVNAPSH